MANKLIQKLELDPKRLFIIDGFGALLSAILSGVVLVRFEKVVGIPSETLYVLATGPIIFSIYDLFSYRKDSIDVARFLKGIAFLNLCYCVLSIGFAFYHIDTITVLGWIYILAETLIVVMLALTELLIANKLEEKKAPAVLEKMD